MASAPTLDIDSLVAPIAGADPAGDPLPFEVRKKLDDFRKEVDPKKFAANDPRRPEQPQLADWSGIEQLAKDTLGRTSKDLLVAARLTEALVKRHGFAGLREGLRLLRRLVQDCWDRMHPVIKDGDMDSRTGPFDWLDDDLRGARFPNTLRTVSLVKDQNLGWQQWKDAQEAKGTVTLEVFEQAVIATKREFCQSSVDDLGESLAELELLVNALTERMGDAAPGLSMVRKSVIECQELAQSILYRKGPAPAAPASGTAAPAGNSHEEAAMSAAAQRRPLTRDDVLARLADASALLLQMEPHSPVAYLVQRAVRLAALPLPELMRVLIRDPNVLVQLDRDLDLGLEKQDKAKAK